MGMTENGNDCDNDDEGGCYTKRQPLFFWRRNTISSRARKMRHFEYFTIAAAENAAGFHIFYIFYICLCQEGSDLVPLL